MADWLLVYNDRDLMDPERLVSYMACMHALNLLGNCTRGTYQLPSCSAGVHAHARVLSICNYEAGSVKTGLF
jgi:hypothetical protein